MENRGCDAAESRSMLSWTSMQSTNSDKVWTLPFMPWPLRFPQGRLAGDKNDLSFQIFEMWVTNLSIRIICPVFKDPSWRYPETEALAQTMPVWTWQLNADECIKSYVFFKKCSIFFQYDMDIFEDLLCTKFWKINLQWHVSEYGEKKIQLKESAGKQEPAKEGIHSSSTYQTQKKYSACIDARSRMGLCNGKTAFL